MPAVKPNIQPVRDVTTFLLDLHEKSALLIRHEPSHSLVDSFIDLLDSHVAAFKGQHLTKPDPDQLNIFES